MEDFLATNYTNFPLIDNREFVAQAEDVIVFFNFTKNEKIQILSGLLEAIEKRENGKAK